MPAVCHGSCDAGGQDSLAQTRGAGKEHALRLGAESRAVTLAAFQITAHHVTGAASVLLQIFIGINIQPELLKAGVTRGQQAGKLLLLLLAAQLPQALAHGFAHVAGAPADGANGAVVQEAVLQLGNQPGPLALQGKILIPQPGHGISGVLPFSEAGGHRLGDGAAELPVDLRQAGIALVGAG